MYHIRKFHKLACDSTSNIFPICGDFNSADYLNIWQIPFKSSMFQFLRDLHSKLSCEDFFVLCYWFCVVVAIVGLMEAISEFIRVFSDAAYNPKTFWNRSYKNISMENQRKARVVGSTLNIVANICLLYGFMNFRHYYVYPWIITNGIIIILELGYWGSNILVNKNFKWRPFMTLTILVLRQAVMIHVIIVINELAAANAGVKFIPVK